MIKTRFKKAGFIVSLCALSWAAPEKKSEAGHVDTNSNAAENLKALNLILKSEFAEKNKVFICKNPGFEDSLIRSLCDESSFKRAISDSSILLEINSQEEFQRFWKTVEANSGLIDLKNQLDARDIDKSLIPKVYAFDSSVVIYPYPYPYSKSNAYPYLGAILIIRKK